MSVKGLTYGRRYVDREPVRSQYLPDPWAADADRDAEHVRRVFAAKPSGFPVLDIKAFR